MPDHQQIMAFDFGLSRIGVAIGSTHLAIAHPLATITGRNKLDKFDKITALIKKWQPQVLVVGKPSQSENKSELFAAINKFANRLKHYFQLPVIFIDEDFSSSQASAQLNEQNIFGRNQHMKLDSLSACAILETYFNHHLKS